MAEVLVGLGEFDDARRHLERGIRLFDTGDVSAVVMFLAAFAALSIGEGDERRGAKLAGAMTGLRDESGTDLVRVGFLNEPNLDPDALGLVGGEHADAYAEGRAMSAADAVALALGDD